PGKLIIGAIVVGALSVLPFYIFAGLANWQSYFQADLRIFIMGVFLLIAALGLWQQLEKSFGQHLSVMSMLCWGALYIYFSLWLMFTPERAMSIERALIFKSIELFLLCSMGL